jgi:site-specific recombinase XerD
MRGPKFYQLVDVAASFYKDQSEAKMKRFLGMASPMLLAFGNRVAATLTTMELENWLLDQADENEWEPPTQNAYKSAMVVIFREGDNANLIKKNPAKLILSAQDANRRMRYFTEEEEQRIRRVTIERALRYGGDGEERLAQMDLAVNTGMRPSEEFGLTWNRVHLEKGKILLVNTKNGHKRDVFLNKRAKGALMFMKERHDRQGTPRNALVFPGGSSTQWFEGVLEEAGIHDAVWYTFRHTTASRLVIRGVHMSLVQKIMGHRTLRMTFRYAHLAAGHLLEAIEKIVPARRPFFGE